jgi:hypothetical protein
VTLLLQLRGALTQARVHLRAFNASGADVEPAEQTVLADATAALPGCIAAAVPGGVCITGVGAGEGADNDGQRADSMRCLPWRWESRRAAAWRRSGASVASVRCLWDWTATDCVWSHNEPSN